ETLINYPIEDFDIGIFVKSIRYNYVDPYAILSKALAFSKSNKTFIHVNSLGTQTDDIFPGGSFIINHQGHLLNEIHHFQERVISVDLNNFSIYDANIYKQKNHAFHYDALRNIPSIYDALIFGIQDYFIKN